MNRILIVLLFILGSFINSSFGQEASSIIAKMDALLFAAKDMQGEMKMTLTSKGGKGKIKESLLYQKGANKRLTVYTKPESQAGIATLSLSDNEMWLYMPALGNPKKISILTKSQAFNNTDFSFEDMSRSPYGDRFTSKLIKTSDNQFFLELKPNYEKSSYSKIVITINKMNHYPEKIEYYDQRGELFKVANYQYTKQGKYWFAKNVLMSNLKKEHSTQIEIFNVKFDQGLKDDLFKVENLRPAKK
ncbi:MAG: outer membrane lipoprotein-sorting protein [Reichenbachiella sp.]